jgi:iron complex outermembrane recepter protein
MGTIAPALIAVAAIAACVPMARAQDMAQFESVKKFSIQVQPLSQALLEFARQADIIVTVSSDLVRGKTAPEIRGDLTPSAVLSQLLQDSGLEAFRTASGGITIGQADTQTEVSSGEPPLAPKERLASGASDARVGGGEIGNDAVIEEILVTAQKRVENIQDVPSSISVYSSRRLKQLHATTITDYAAYIPGLNVTSGGGPGRTMITLRGIAPVGPGAVVGFYVDETPLGSSSNYGAGREFGLDLMPYDVERIEVLRGPQGTLYGAGAMGGLLKYVLRDPDLRDFNAWAGVESSSVVDANDLGWGVRAGVNAPLIAERLGLWASYSNQETPGYIDNAYTGGNDENDVRQRGGRVALTWRIDEDVSLKLGGLWQRIDATGDATTALTLTGLNPPTGAASFGELTDFHPLPEPFEQAIDHYSATLDWDLGWASLLSASGYSRTHIHHVQDVSFSVGFLYPLATAGAVAEGFATFPVTLDLDKRTQEFRLTSPAGGRIEWMIGAFYTKEVTYHAREVFALDTDGEPIAQFAPRLLFVEFPSRYEELAGFGSTTFKLTGRFDITGGVRWARNEQKFRQISGGLASVIGPPADFRGSSSERVVTYMVSPRLHINDDTMLYARVATGYRPGGPNPRVLDMPPTVAADTLTNYEVGLKTQLLQRRALINIAAFYIDWKDIQQTVSFGQVSGIDNVGDAVSKGFELETLYSPLEPLRIGINAAYTDAQLTAPEQGISGAKLGNVPRWSASAVLEYELSLADAWRLRIGGGYRYVGEQGAAVATQIGADTSYVRPSYKALDLATDLMRGNWTLRLFARNVLDERAYTGGEVMLDAANVPYGIDVNMLQPRTVGVSVDVNF